MKRLLFFITLAIALILPGIAAAQLPDKVPTVVKWTISSRMTGTDTGVLTLRAVPSAGWHLYSTELPEGGPKATRIDLSQSTGLLFEGEPSPSAKPIEVNDPLFGIDLAWWESPVTFTVKFKLNKGVDAAQIKARITFMACNDETCSAPSTVNLQRAIRLAKQ